MSSHIILASTSSIRRTLLQNAGVPFTAIHPAVDEDAIKASLLQEAAKPRDIADCLAEAKAKKISAKHPDAIVIGSDQTLAFGDDCLDKPQTQTELKQQLVAMRGNRHKLFSAAVVYHQSQPQWRHVAQATMYMRAFSDTYLDAYLDRNWEEVRHCVGGYQLESEGARLFDRIDGDYFTVLGLPLLPLLSYLSLRGTLEG